MGCASFRVPRFNQISVRESGESFVRGRVSGISVETGTAFPWNKRFIDYRRRVFSFSTVDNLPTHFSPTAPQNKPNPGKAPNHTSPKNPKQPPNNSQDLLCNTFSKYFIDRLGTPGYQPALVMEHPHQFHTYIRQ